MTTVVNQTAARIGSIETITWTMCAGYANEHLVSRGRRRWRWLWLWEGRREGGGNGSVRYRIEFIRLGNWK